MGQVALGQFAHVGLGVDVEDADLKVFGDDFGTAQIDGQLLDKAAHQDLPVLPEHDAVGVEAAGEGDAGAPGALSQLVGVVEPGIEHVQHEAGVGLGGAVAPFLLFEEADVDIFHHGLKQLGVLSGDGPVVKDLHHVDQGHAVIPAPLADALELRDLSRCGKHQAGVHMVFQKTVVVIEFLHDLRGVIAVFIQRHIDWVSTLVVLAVGDEAVGTVQHEQCVFQIVFAHVQDLLVISVPEQHVLQLGLPAFELQETLLEQLQQPGDGAVLLHDDDVAQHLGVLPFLVAEVAVADADIVAVGRAVVAEHGLGQPADIQDVRLQLVVRVGEQGDPAVGPLVPGGEIGPSPVRHEQAQNGVAGKLHGLPLHRKSVRIDVLIRNEMPYHSIFEGKGQ